jgi:prepilin-type N-terminal cleavage/methylation domain-containing protein
MRQRLVKGNRGFTLVELVVVIAILGVLAGVASLKFVDNYRLAKGAKLIADMRTIESAAKMYYAANGVWPDIVINNSKKPQDNTPNQIFTTKYLNGWPLPPTGKFTIVGYNKETYTYQFTNQKYYSFVADETSRPDTYGMVTCDFKTVDDFLKGKAGSLLVINGNSKTTRTGSGPLTNPG